MQLEQLQFYQLVGTAREGDFEVTILWNHQFDVQHPSQKVLGTITRRIRQIQTGILL